MAKSRRRNRCTAIGGAFRANGKRLQRQRGERTRNFAHQFDSGGLTVFTCEALRTCTRSLDPGRRVQPRAPDAARRSGKPRAAHDRAVEAILMFLAVIQAVEDLFRQHPRSSTKRFRFSPVRRQLSEITAGDKQGFRHGLLTSRGRVTRRSSRRSPESPVTPREEAAMRCFALPLLVLVTLCTVSNAQNNADRDLARALANSRTRERAVDSIVAGSRGS